LKKEIYTRLGKKVEDQILKAIKEKLRGKKKLLRLGFADPPMCYYSN
jgi:hypothetical protein